MPQRKKTSSNDSSDLLAIYSTEMTFGDYMRSLRNAQNISLRALAKEVNKTPTYISDIENGNNRPPDKELLESILSALQINEYPKIKAKLYDLAALGRGDLPADIKTFILHYPDTITILRSFSSYSNIELLLTEIASKYCDGGKNNESE